MMPLGYHDGTQPRKPRKPLRKLWDITAIERSGRLTGQQIMNERNQAVVLMLLSALSFSLMQAVVKLSATNIGTMEQVFLPQPH